MAGKSGNTNVWFILKYIQGRKTIFSKFETLSTLILIKIVGTDSRLGWGFRLGDRADFQVMLELGPQINTQKLSNEKEEAKSSNSKRNTLDTLAETLYAQRQQDKKEKEKKIQKEKKKVSSWFQISGGLNLCSVVVTSFYLVYY